jgi:hypothetical protein
MSRVAFISDINTPLGNSLVRLYLRDKNRVFATFSVETEESIEEEYDSLKESAGEALLIERWNRGSPISAKNVFLKALNHFGTLDELLLLGNPSLSAPPLHEISFETIERSVDEWIKGNLFLLKSVLSRYLEKRGGILALINLRNSKPSSPLEEALQRSFSGLAHSLITSYGDKGVNIITFESALDEPEEYAEYIYRNLSEKGNRQSGRWLRYRRGFFSNI